MKAIHDCKNWTFQSLKLNILLPHFTFLILKRHLLIYFLIIFSPFLMIYLTQNNSVRTSFFEAKPNVGITDPIWFLHVSDFHLSQQKPKSFPKIYRDMNKVVSAFLPAKVIITGDLTDNADLQPTESKSLFNFLEKISKKYHPYHKQFKEDWHLYQDLLEKFHLKEGENLISVLGNHDVFGRNQKPLNFSSISIETMHLYFNERKISRKIKFIKLNPYSFPSPPITFHRKVYPTNDLLNKLQTILEKDSSEISFIICHNPRLRFISSKKLDSITKHSTNLKLMITGHFHPPKHSFLHFGKSLEVVSTALFRQSEVGIITYDSGCCVYHVIDIWQNDTFSFLTKPMPIEQVTNFDSFYSINSKNEVEFNAISFSYSKPKLLIKGDFNGKLHCVKRINQFSIMYQHNFSYYYFCNNSFPIPPNHYKEYFEIEKLGDWTGVVKFPAKKVVKPFYERKYVDYISTGYLFIYPFLFLCFLYPLITDFSSFHDNNNSGSLFTNQVELSLEVGQLSLISKFLTCKTTSLFVVYTIVRRLLIILLLSSFFLPLSIFTKSDDKEFQQIQNSDKSVFIFYWFGYFLFFRNVEESKTLIEFRSHFVGSEYLVKYFVAAIMISILLQFILKIIIVDLGHRKNYSTINSTITINHYLFIFILVISLFTLSSCKFFYHFMRLVDLLGLIPALISFSFSILPFFFILFEIIEIILLFQTIRITKKNASSSDQNFL